ncbi:DUF1513 domain-containing protein [Pelagibaculum spongiae]|uniref:DUF1513 domain-containing protein n=1 Tax=Pelagibaculum spongiae TaxID=2080658 RepID=A0A2V1H666_9GAMM|nr:DUF1513 domain-containing protein [Pelagibaculum spongiae]PVZ72245.1 DUF1513 domain-containing protein [Pelagibaculum spongiae]
MMNRRSFLMTAAATTAAILLPTSLLAAISQQHTDKQFYSGMADSQGNYFLSATDLSGKKLFEIPLPARGHAPTLSPDGKQLVMVARRPENWLLVANLQTGQSQTLQGHPNRHLHGHGVFSANGQWFYTTENDFDNQRGVIGIYDVENQFERTGEFASGGIGPHELLLSPDGQYLIIANGGILTHPDTGRAKLNLESMQPNLAIIERTTGKQVIRQQLDKKYHQLSIRHIAVNQDFSVGIALQYQGKKSDRHPLIALWKPGSEIKLLDIPANKLDRMRNYCGSITMDSNGQVMAVSSPRGGLISYWSTDNGQWLGHSDLADGCGIAASGKAGEFLISGGRGDLILYRPCNDRSGVSEQSITIGKFDGRWDNHLV